MSKITFILGGARSGKSWYAQKLAEDSGKLVTFIATAQAFDEEMKMRIEKHRADRPSHWQTCEVQKNIPAYLIQNQLQTQIYLLDCITLLASNVFMQFIEDDLVNETKAQTALQNEIAELIKYIQQDDKEWIIVSNEVGLGLVPPYQMGRVYRDLLGWANQSLAKEADSVLFMVSGIPMKVK